MTSLIALLGRADQPTDAVEAYCEFLGAALARDELSMEIRRMQWHALGWFRALRALRNFAAKWRGRWVFVQYTALSWSSRGFPWRFLIVLKLLLRAGATVAVVYHDAEPYPALRLREKARRRVQLWTMRRALRICDLAIFTIPLDKLSWLPNPPQHALFVPVGANFPPPQPESRSETLPAPLTVSVFGVTGGAPGEQECFH